MGYVQASLKSFYVYAFFCLKFGHACFVFIADAFLFQVVLKVVKINV